MPYGIIERMVPAHGYGFIRDDSGLDWFFRQDDVRGGRFDLIWPGERVGFKLEPSPAGPRAADVHHEQLD